MIGDSNINNSIQQACNDISKSCMNDALQAKGAELTDYLQYVAEQNLCAIQYEVNNIV